MKRLLFGTLLAAILPVQLTAPAEVAMNRATRLIILAVVVLVVAILAAGTASATTPGSWEAYPGQSTVDKTQVKQPINADGSSVFANNDKAVIPVKFSLLSGLGPFVFESICSDNPGCSPLPGKTANDLLLPELHPRRIADLR
jgi:hypothetical protein